MGFLRCVLAMTFLVALGVGCDQLNKPIRPLRNPPRTPSTASDAGEPADGGAPAPSITAQPGDIHL